MIFRLILQALQESIANQSQSSECCTPAANPKPNLPDLYSDILVSGSDMEAESKEHRSGNQSSPDGGTATHKPTEVPFSEEPEPLIDQRNVPALRQSKAALEVKHKKNDLDLFFRAQITNMIALINLFLDPQLDFGWIESSELAAKAAGRGINHARNLCRWVVDYMQHGNLPLNNYGQLNTSILGDEDLAQQIHLHLLGIAKDGYVRAQDVVDLMATPDMKSYLGIKTGITVCTAQRWLNAMKWRYGKPSKGMYLDGHE